MAMKGMTSIYFVYTAPCAVDSYCISTGIFTSNYFQLTSRNRSKIDETSDVCIGSFGMNSHLFSGVICRGDVRGLISAHSALHEQFGWLDSHGIARLNLWGYNYEV